MATTPVYGWPIPNLTDVADGPDGFSDLALAIEGTMNSKTVTSYTPAWTSAGSVQPANPASRSGWYRVQNGVCDFTAQITFSASTTGGKGALSIGLPTPANGSIQRQFCGSAHLLVAGVVNYDRQFGFISTGANGTSVGVWFPVDRNSSNYGAWQNSDETAALGTGIPAIPSNIGGWAIRNGGYISVMGRYFTT